MKTPFTYELLENQNLERIDSNTFGRFYKSQSGKHYPSVTSVLSKLDDSWITDWINRVGIEEAEKITRQALYKGSQLHEILEKYLLQEEFDKSDYASITLSSFRKIKEELDKNVSIIRGIEHQMYSNILGVAGTSDLIGVWKDKEAVIDFKTSRSEKVEEEIQKYFYQTSIYSLMLAELYKIKIEKIVIIMITDFSKPKIFEKNPTDFYPKLKEIFRISK